MTENDPKSMLVFTSTKFHDNVLQKSCRQLLTEKGISQQYDSEPKQLHSSLYCTYTVYNLVATQLKKYYYSPNYMNLKYRVALIVLESKPAVLTLD